jgi:excisionase family DNA binding protein
MAAPGRSDGVSLVPGKGVFGQMVPAYLLTARETAKALRISEKTLWNITKSGSIQAVRFGRARPVRSRCH